MEEISLKEYIEVLLNGKKLIAIITIITMALGLIVGFVQPKVYEARAVILTNPINSNETKEIDTATLNGVINSMSQYPQMDINTYKEQFLDSKVVVNTIQELNLVNKDGTYITANQLRGKVTVTNPEDTNLLTIEVKDNDPELAANIANTLCKYFSQYISELNNQQGKMSSEAIKNQMEIEAENLAAEAKKLEDYLVSSPSIDALKNQIQALITQISNYKTSLNDVETSIDTDTLALKNLLQNNQSVLGLNLGDISINVPSGGGSGSFEFNLNSANQLQNSLLTMEITNTETRLNSHLAQKQALTAKITQMEESLAQLQATVAQEESKYNAIQRDYNLANQTYTAYQDKYKQATITAASDLGRVSIQISSEALVPEEPSNLSKVMILAISAVLGFMIAVFVVFFKQYWNVTNVTEVSTEKK